AHETVGTAKPPYSFRCDRGELNACAARLERALQRLQHAYRAQRAGRAGTWLGARRDALDEVPALDSQRLLVRHLRAHHVSRTGDVLAPVAKVAVEALVVDGHL